MEEKELIKMYFGSKIYGTSVPESDIDIKYVFQPTAQSLLLENPAKQKQNKSSDDTKKNTKDDIDLEGFSLKNFLYQLAAGQTFAMDMLFTPPEFYMTKPDSIWNIILENKDKLLSKKVNAFVGYCRAQFTKYCVKSERLNAIQKTVSTLELFSRRDKIGDILSALMSLETENPELISVDMFNKMFSCCGRKMPFGATVQLALDSYSKVLGIYGNRTKIALDADAIDWKALYHAVRVAREAEELLLTGHVTLPRPEKDLLLQIRNKELSFDFCSELIEEGLEKVETALLKSTLPDEPDFKFINSLVITSNWNEIHFLHPVLCPTLDKT